MNNVAPTRDPMASLREIHFAHGGFRASLTLPRAADDLIDEAAFMRDERLPYWADLWPSARALARYLVDHPVMSADRPKEPTAIEFGCGAAALPSLALVWQGVSVLATDYEPPALRLAAINAAHLPRGPSCAAGGRPAGAMRAAHLDWRQWQPSLGRFDLAVVADAMYEQRNAIALADLVPRVLNPGGGRLLLADPGRRYLDDFASRMRQAGCRGIDLAMIREPQDQPDKPASQVRIIEFTMP